MNLISTAYAALTCRAMKTVLALMAKVMMAMRGHITRSEWRISFCKRERNKMK